MVEAAPIVEFDMFLAQPAEEAKRRELTLTDVQRHFARPVWRPRIVAMGPRSEFRAGGYYHPVKVSNGHVHSDDSSIHRHFPGIYPEYNNVLIVDENGHMILRYTSDYELVPSLEQVREYFNGILGGQPGWPDITAIGDSSDPTRRIVAVANMPPEQAARAHKHVHGGAYGLWNNVLLMAPDGHMTLQFSW